MFLFRSFLPLHNPIGFGATDFIELELAALLVLLILAHTALGGWARRLAAHTGRAMVALGILAIALRLALFAQSPVPTANGSDEFSHLLAADTLRHFRLANPPHPLARFFETTFVLQEPTYSSIFPIGQAIALALGRLLFGLPWAGVLLSAGALCGLCYWMLRGWISPGWAFAGGLLAVIQFGPLRYWMNTYWGGAVSAVGGCLVFGALPRLRERGRIRDAILLGIGIGIQLLTRPFECVLLVLAVMLFFLPDLRRPADWRKLARVTAVAALSILPAAGLTLLQNEQVTGSWLTLPYMLSRYEYGVPTTFTLQPLPVPHRELTAGQQLNYEEQSATHGFGAETLGSYLARLGGRARFYRFFFLPPLYLVLPFFLTRVRRWRYGWVALALAIFSLGTNFYPYFYPHYIAAATCLFLLAAVSGLETLSRITIRGVTVGREAAALILILCAAQFLFWYGFHLFANTNASQAMLDYDSWDDVNHGDPLGRIAVNDRLTHAPGKQLVFVRYWPRHRFQEWVHNAADIDRAQVVWALDRGADEDEKLRRYYPDRTAWLLEPDAHPPRLSSYQQESLPENVAAPAPKQPREKPSPGDERHPIAAGTIVVVRVFLLCVLWPLAAAASEHWVRFTSGPIEVYSSAGSKDGRETLVKFEEFRHALGLVLGDDNLQLPVPVRILLFKTGAPETAEPVVRGRDQYNVVLTAGQAIPDAVFARLTQLFLDTNTARMPERIERGLISLFSTIQVSGIRITVGEPPRHPDLDWARVHLLIVSPEYYGKLRVLTYNLRKGVDEDAAFRNALGKTPEQIELEAQKHLAEGRFAATTMSSLPMSPTDFPERQVEPAAAQLAIADLLDGDRSRAIYRELIAQKERVPESWEGLGMLALRDRNSEEARKDFAAAMEAGAKSPECYMEYARLETDHAKALAALERAVKINPKLAEPHFLMAQHQTDAVKRIQELKLAAKLDARNMTYWETLAEAYLNDHDYPQAAQAWKSAEQAATTPGDRARMARKRLEVEEQRLDWEDAEKKRKADEEAREMERLKQQARAELHAAEARANQGQSPAAPNEKVVPWWEGPKAAGVARGMLKQVDCLGNRLRLVILDDDQKTVKLLVADPAQIAVLGGQGEMKLSCGAQGMRRVKVEYFPKPNAKLATKGEVATIEFQ